MVPKTNEKTSIQESVEKFSKKGQICGMETKTCSSFPCFKGGRLLSRWLQSRTQGFLFLQLPVGGLSSEEQQDFSLSHHATRYLLLRLILGQEQSRGGCSLLLLSAQFMDQRLYLGHGGSENTRVMNTTAMAFEAVASLPGKRSWENLRLLLTLPTLPSLSSQLQRVCHSEKHTTDPTTQSYRAVRR